MDSDFSNKTSGFGIGEIGSIPESSPDSMIDTAKILDAQPKIKVKFFKCSCGHTIPDILVMNASLGTSCPDCYDRMSDL